VISRDNDRRQYIFAATNYGYIFTGELTARTVALGLVEYIDSNLQRLQCLLPW
jgi:hypothetical protein